MNSPDGTTEYEWEERLVDYMFGTMEPEAAARFEQELQACRLHVTLARQYEGVIGIMGSSVAAAEPPAGHKSRFMARLAATPQGQDASADELATTQRPALQVVSRADVGRETATPTMPAPLDIESARRERAERAEVSRRRIPIAPLVASIAAALVVLLGVWVWLLSGRGDELGGYVAFPILPQEGRTESGVAFYNPESDEALVYANGLQALPSGQVYELWLLRPDGNHQAAGIFRGDASGRASHQYKAPAKVTSFQGFAVTIEPGLVDKPTGPIVMANTFR